MALIDKEAVRKEIERLIKKDNYELFDVPALLSFLDTLKETPTWVNRAEQRQKDQAAGRWIAIMEIRTEIERIVKAILYSDSSRYDASNENSWRNAVEDIMNVFDTLPEQPAEGLEKEIHDYMFQLGERDSSAGTLRDRPNYMRIVEKVARYFAEWGVEHLRKKTSIEPQ